MKNEGKQSHDSAVRVEHGSGQLQGKPKLWSATFVVIIIATLCSFICGQGLNSGTSVYLDGIGQSAALAGSLALVFSAGAAVIRIISGPLLDATGRYKVIVGGGVLLIGGSVACAFASTVPGFVAVRFVQGFGFGAITTATAAAASDVLPLERLGEGIGYYGLGQAIAMSVGPAFALFLVGTDPATNLFFGIGAVATLATTFGAFITYERHIERLPKTSEYRMRIEAQRASGVAAGPKPTLMQILRIAFKPENIIEKRALPGGIPMMILSPTFGFGIFFVGLYGTKIGIGATGMFYTISALVMIACRLAGGRFMDTVAPIKIAAVYTVSALVAMGLLLGAAVYEPCFYVAGAFYGLALGLSLPLNQAVSVKNTPSEHWGAANALFLLLNDVGIGVSSVVWGVVNDMLGFSATICCVMFCIVASFIVAKLMYPKE